ncbi:peptidoglycan-associated lipoprotein Pal [Dinoroseobacter sp. S76]|uniref:peptidoglycan-associated lipoprotein Pal n=1 Tax=Dinoroseobacter sp. S76 TaxID=3415124 RepID=UPI003C7D319B
MEFAKTSSRARLSLALVAALAVSGCAGSGGLFGSAGGAGGGSGPTTAGDFGDPSSPQYFQQAIGDRVLFAVDQSTLSPEAQQLVSQQAAWLMSNGAYTAVIEGHADEQGTREYNLALGARRASAVRDFMVAQGVADSRLSTVTFGKERPIEICSNESCYAQNRRAVTVLSAGPTS